jgi:hypothetical protein
MKKQKSERGQSLVELSISLLVLLYLLSGAVEFGLAFFQFVQLRDAAQEGALFGSMNPAVGITSIETRVRAASGSPIDLAQDDPGQPNYVSVLVTAKDTDGDVIPANGACEGDALTVEVSYDHHIFMPFMSKIIGPTIPLRAEVTDTVLAPVQTAASCAP